MNIKSNDYKINDALPKTESNPSLLPEQQVEHVQSQLKKQGIDAVAKVEGNDVVVKRVLRD